MGRRRIVLGTYLSNDPAPGTDTWQIMATILLPRAESLFPKDSSALSVLPLRFSLHRTTGSIASPDAAHSPPAYTPRWNCSPGTAGQPSICVHLGIFCAVCERTDADVPVFEADSVKDIRSLIFNAKECVLRPAVHVRGSPCPDSIGRLKH